MKIYFLSGLGADKRAFQYLTFPERFEKVYLEWILPIKNETLRGYAKRISEKIDHSEPFILIGLSFGGILSTEVLEFVKPEKTFLISSVARRIELPLFYRISGRLQLNKLLPESASNRSNLITHWIFGISDPKDKFLLNEILVNTDIRFSKWAVNALLNWHRKETPDNIIRIHGNKDKLLPILNCKPDYVINNAGHFMVFVQAKQVSEILKKELEGFGH